MGHGPEGCITVHRAPRDPKALAENPSIGAYIYQARTLIDRLKSLMTQVYPPQTAQLARLLIVLSERTLSILQRIDALSHKRLTEAKRKAALSAGRFIHSLNSYLRYLQATEPFSSPPGVRYAVDSLVDRFAATALKCRTNQIVVLVRPQWTYNLKFVDLIGLIGIPDPIYTLDPDKEYAVTDFRQLLALLWNAYRNNLPTRDQELFGEPPKHVAVLSFAGLDRDDVLLYPLLAHELAHFIDSGYPSGIHTNDKVMTPTWQIAPADVEELIKDDLDKYPISNRQVHLTKKQIELSDLISTSLAEIAADLLATRMVGIAYFFALAEYFKNIYEKLSTTINPKSGYPGAMTRP